MRKGTTAAVLAVMIAATLVAASNAPAGQQAELRWRYEAGTELIYRQTVTSETDMPGQGMATTENIYTQRWNVLDIADNGDATVQISTDRVQMTMDSPMGTVTIDSASGEEPDNPQMKILTAMAGMSFTLVLSPTGELQGIEGVEELQARVREAFGDEQAGAMLDQVLDQSFSEDALKSMFQQGVQSFPDRAVGPGDTWETALETIMPMIGNMTTTMEFTLDRIEERNGSTIAVISSLGTIDMVADESNPMAGMVEIGNAATIGTIEFDVDRGILLRSTGSTHMEMILKMGGQEQVLGTIANVVMELVEGAP